MQLFDHDSQTQSELLERAGLDHSTVSKSLLRMQKAGLATREPAAHDRRVMVVSLTDTGRTLQEPIAVRRRTLDQISVRDPTPHQAETFTRCAHIIEKPVRNHTRQPPVGRTGTDTRPPHRASCPLPRAQRATPQGAGGAKGPPRSTGRERGACVLLPPPGQYIGRPPASSPAPELQIQQDRAEKEPASAACRSGPRRVRSRRAHCSAPSSPKR